MHTVALTLVLLLQNSSPFCRGSFNIFAICLKFPDLIQKFQFHIYEGHLKGINKSIKLRYSAFKSCKWLVLCYSAQRHGNRVYCFTVYNITMTTVYNIIMTENIFLVIKKFKVSLLK